MLFTRSSYQVPRVLINNSHPYCLCSKGQSAYDVYHSGRKCKGHFNFIFILQWSLNFRPHWHLRTVLSILEHNTTGVLSIVFICVLYVVCDVRPVSAHLRPKQIQLWPTCAQDFYRNTLPVLICTYAWVSNIRWKSTSSGNAEPYAL